MSANTISIVRHWDWRRILFTIIGGVVTFFILSNLFRLAAPWASMASYPHDDPRQLNPELHRWHEAMWGAVTGILEGGALLTLLWRPRENPLLIQFIALNVILAAPIMLPFEPGLLFVIVMIALVVAAYPVPRALLDFSRAEPLSRPLLGLGIVAALLLLPYIWRLAFWQIQGLGGEQAVANQWISDVEHAVFILVAAFLASTKRPGWRTLSILLGTVLLYLGVAALTLPSHAGSWGVAGGIAALVGGLLYIVVTIRESSKKPYSSSGALPSVAS